MINKRLLIIAIILISRCAFAATVQQIIPSENKAALGLDPNEQVTVNDVFLANFEGQNCPLPILSVASGYSVVDLSKCTFKDKIKNGDKVEKSLIPIDIKNLSVTPAAVNPPTQAPTEEIDDNYILFGGIVYFSAADTLKFDDVEVSSSSASGRGSIEYKSTSSPGFGLHFGLAPKSSWGFIGSLNYEPGRSIKSVTVSGANGTGYGSYNDGPRVSFVYFEANAVYRWNKFYLPFGFNYSIPDITNDPSNSSYTYQGGLGADLGVGYFATDHLSLELWSRSLAMKIQGTDGVYKIDYGTGFLSGIGFGLRVWY